MFCIILDWEVQLNLLKQVAPFAQQKQQPDSYNNNNMKQVECIIQTIVLICLDNNQ